MAVIHKATLNPTKLELIASWLPAQPWFLPAAVIDLVTAGSFRFDDPDGEVGIQVITVRAGADGPLYQVPMTYRDAPLAGAEAGFMGEMSHSVLGRRFVHDACYDPVFVDELVRVMLAGDGEVDEIVEVDGNTVTLPKTMHVRGSGDGSIRPQRVESLAVSAAGTLGSLAVVRADGVEVIVPRVLDPAVVIEGTDALAGTWPTGESDAGSRATRFR